MTSYNAYDTHFISKMLNNLDSGTLQKQHYLPGFSFSSEDENEETAARYLLADDDEEIQNYLKAKIAELQKENQKQLHMLLDLEKRARLRAEVLASNLQLAIQSRDDFLSIASHELKTPLTSLKLQLQMTKRRIDPTMNFSSKETFNADKLLNFFNTSDRQINRLTELIDDLLDVSKIRAGKIEYRYEKVNVLSLVNEVVERFADQLENARCQIELKISPEIVAIWDRIRMEQVLTNLLSNAVKYAPEKPIHISVIQINNRISLIVKDHGPGISNCQKQKIFERFERATSSRNISGLGLGLFIVSEIVKSHDGNVRVESEEGHGASFIVDIPVKH